VKKFFDPNISKGRGS